jgi:hypothetical protein
MRNTMENPKFDVHAQAIEQGWEESRRNEVVSRLKANEDLQTIMNSLPGFREAFHELDTIDCSDGRVLRGKKIGIAGSGLLLSPEERAKFIERYRGKIKEVTTHRDCGAAAKKFAEIKAVSPEAIPAGIENADDYGTDCGQKLAEELGARHRFLDMEQMANESHNEVAIVLDGTARFDSTNFEGFPPHFVCTGAGLGFSPEYMKAELETLSGIALGHHGYGKRFDRENPLYIMVVAKNYAEQIEWENVAQEAARKFGGNVAVKGFVSPEGK